MKKLVSLTLAVLFVMVMACAAFAAETTFEGQYRVRAWSDWNFDKKPVVPAGEADPLYTGFFDQRFRLTITHTRSEFLKAVVRLDLVEDIWGQQRGFRSNYRVTGDIIDIAYLEFSLPKMGTFTVGAFPQLFGYGLSFANTGPCPNGIKWSNKWGMVGVSAMYFKYLDNVTFAGPADPAYNRDANFWALDLTITPNDMHNIELWGGLYTDDDGLPGSWAFEYIDDNFGAGEAHNVTSAAGIVGIAYTGNIADMIDIKAEYSRIFGRAHANEIGALLSPAFDRDPSLEGWNLFLDASYYNDMFRVGLAFLMGSGQNHIWSDGAGVVAPGTIHNINTNFIADHENFMNPDDFAFSNIIANGGHVPGVNYWGGPGFGDDAENLTALKLYFEVSPMEKLTLNAAVIWAKWTNPVGSGLRVLPAGPGYPHPINGMGIMGEGRNHVYDSWKASNDLGWEIDFGFNYDIMEGLSYSFGAGVLFTGDSFDYVNEITGEREDWGPIWSISNTLMYEF
jgi:hypothetical protein